MRGADECACAGRVCVYAAGRVQSGSAGSSGAHRTKPTRSLASAAYRGSWFVDTLLAVFAHDPVHQPISSPLRLGLLTWCCVCIDPALMRLGFVDTVLAVFAVDAADAERQRDREQRRGRGGRGAGTGPGRGRWK